MSSYLKLIWKSWMLVVLLSVVTVSSTTTTTKPPAVNTGCGTTKGCFETGFGMVTYSNDGDGNITMELHSTTGQWIAAGYSTDQSMGSDSVNECVYNNGLSRVIVQHSYNVVSNNRLVANPTTGIQILEATYANSELYCRFKRRINGYTDTEIFDLNRMYYLLLATGDVNAATGNKIEHTSRQASNSKVNLTAITVVSGSGRCSNCLKRAHGCLMISAWVLFVSTSIILARYYKTAWPGKKIGDTPVWFAIHRILMIAALLCTAIAFIIIFVTESGAISTYPSTAPEYFQWHAPLGIIVMILVIANPVMAIFRCHPGTKYRPIYNWMHWLVGLSVHVISVVTMLIGLKIGESQTLIGLTPFWLLVAFIAFHCGIEVLLTCQKLYEEIQSKKEDSTNEPHSNGTSSAHDNKTKPDDRELSAGGSSNLHVTSQNDKTKGSSPTVLRKPYSSGPSKWGLVFRYVIFSVYGVVVIGLWLAMIILVGSGTIP